MEITIYHNPKCGTSRNTLAMIRQTGIEPQIIDYLKTPLTETQLRALLHRLNCPVGEVVRRKEAIFTELGLHQGQPSDETLIAAMLRHPILMNRPIVVSPLGARLCRPSEAVLALLPKMQGVFTKEDGEQVVL